MTGHWLIFLKTDLRSSLTCSSFPLFSITCWIKFNIFKPAFKVLYNIVPTSLSRLSTTIPFQATRTQPNSTTAIPYTSPTLQYFDTFAHSVRSAQVHLPLSHLSSSYLFPSASSDFTFCKKTHRYTQLEGIQSYVNSQSWPPCCFFCVESILVYVSSPYISLLFHLIVSSL